MLAQAVDLQHHATLLAPGTGDCLPGVADQVDQGAAEHLLVEVRRGGTFGQLELELDTAGQDGTPFEWCFGVEPFVVDHADAFALLAKELDQIGRLEPRLRQPSEARELTHQPPQRPHLVFDDLTVVSSSFWNFSSSPP